MKTLRAERSIFKSNSNSNFNSSNNDNNDFDRKFYLDDNEDGPTVDQSTDSTSSRFLFENDKTREREAKLDKQRAAAKSGMGHGAMKEAGMSARKSALNDDQNRWEENRLLTSGAAVQGSVSLEVNSEDDSRIQLLVHQIKPPFLGGRVAFSTIQKAVATVRDNSSDFAKLARSGSAVLKELRERKDKGAMRQKFWELGGSRMGDAMRVESKTESGDKGQEMGDVKVEERLKVDKGDGDGDGGGGKQGEEEVEEGEGGEVNYKVS